MEQLSGLKDVVEIVAAGVEIVKDGIVPAVSFAWDRLKHYSPETRNIAVPRMRDFAEKFGCDVRVLRDAGLLTDDDISERILEPAFAHSLQSSMLDASEASSEFKHEQLAALVANQLLGRGESFRSISLRFAAERIKNLTDTQLLQLGLMFAIVHGKVIAEPPSEGAPEFYEYAARCEVAVKPFDAVDLNILDIQHMQGLSLLDIAPYAWPLGGGRSSGEETYATMLNPLNTTYYGLLDPLGSIQAPPVIHRIQDVMHGVNAPNVLALRGINLFPSAYLIGYCVYSNLHGEPMDLSEFD